MQGWIVPPPKEPTKTKEQFKRERQNKVRWLIKHGYLGSERIKKAMLKVPREDFIPYSYKDYAYCKVPFPLPGERASISCPHSYPLFYEPLGLGEGHKFLPQFTTLICRRFRKPPLQHSENRNPIAKK